MLPLGLIVVILVMIIFGLVSFLSERFTKPINLAEITKNNTKYHYRWTIKSFPFWKSETEIGWLEVRCFDDNDLIKKTEYWATEKKLDTNEVKSTFLFYRKGIDQGYYFGINRVIEASNFTFEHYSNGISFLAMKYTYRRPCFVLSRNGEIVTDKLTVDSRRRYDESVPLLYDPDEDEIIYVAKKPTDENVLHEQIYAQSLTGENRSLRSDVHEPYSIRYFWMHKKMIISDRIICTTFSNPDPDPDPKKWEMTMTTLWALPLEGTNEPEKLGIIESQGPMLGWSISPDLKFLAAGGAGIFHLDGNLHIGEKVCDLNMIHPAWSPSGHKLIGLKTKIEGTEDQVRTNLRTIILEKNTVSVEQFPKK